MCAYWGAMPPRPTAQPDSSGNSSNGTNVIKDYIVKARNMEIEGPTLHQPSSKHYPPVNECQTSPAFQMDSLALHSIRLIQQARRLRSLIHSATAQLTDLKNGESSDTSLSFAQAPPIPEYTGRKLKYQPDKKQALPFLHPLEEPSAFVSGEWGSTPPPPEIDHRTNRRLLRKSVAAITAHSGFDNCGEGVLETLTDISHEYMLQMTRLLRRAVDNRSIPHMGGATGFPDSVEQVFYEMGIGSMTTLHDFYQNRVITYHGNLLASCRHLLGEYEALTSPEAASRIRDESLRGLRVKDEPMSDINFPSMDESEDGGTDSEQVMHLDSLGLDISVTQESTGSVSQEEDAKWQQATKTEPPESSFSFKTSSLCSSFLLSPKLPPPPPPPPPYKSPGRRIIDLDPSLLSPSSGGADLIMPTSQLLLSPNKLSNKSHGKTNFGNSMGSLIQSSKPLSHSVRRKLQEKVRLRNRESSDNAGNNQQSTAAAQSTAADVQGTAAMSTASQGTAAKSTAAHSTASLSTASQGTASQGTAAKSTAVQSTGQQLPPPPRYSGNSVDMYGGDDTQSSTSASEVARTPLSEDHNSDLTSPSQKPPKKKKKR